MSDVRSSRGLPHRLQEAGWIFSKQRAVSPRRWWSRSSAGRATRSRRSGPRPRPLRFGREDFSPDFRVSQADAEGAEREFLVEVKYRPSVEQFISVENQRGERSIFLLARRQWPALYFILVTERPGARPLLLPGGRLRDPQRPGEPFRTVDLIEVKEFGLFPHNIEDHEELVRRIFALLTA